LEGAGEAGVGSIQSSVGRAGCAGEFSWQLPEKDKSSVVSADGTDEAVDHGGEFSRFLTPVASGFVGRSSLRRVMATLSAHNRLYSHFAAGQRR